MKSECLVMLLPESRKTSKQCYENDEGYGEDDDSDRLEHTHRKADEFPTASSIILVPLVNM